MRDFFCRIYTAHIHIRVLFHMVRILKSCSIADVILYLAGLVFYKPAITWFMLTKESISYIIIFSYLWNESEARNVLNDAIWGNPLSLDYWIKKLLCVHLEDLDIDALIFVTPMTIFNVLILLTYHQLLIQNIYTVLIRI